MQLYASKYSSLAANDKPAEPINNIPILILHGLFGSNRNWHPIARSLSEKHIVYTLDLRNHGKSPHSDMMDYPQMAGDVLEFINKNNIERVNIIAHSMGGKVAMWLALSQPERVHKLVVVDIAPVTYQHDFADVLAAFQSVPLASITSRQQADNYLAQTISQSSLRQFLLQNLQFKEGHYRWRLNLQAISRCISHITGFPDVSNIQPFPERVLFIGGGQSDYLNKSNQQLTRKLFPKASFSIIKPAGHWLHAEQPELFLALVEPYLSSK